MKIDENGHEVLACQPEPDSDASKSDDSEDTKYAKGVRRSNRYQPSPFIKKGWFRYYWHVPGTQKNRAVPKFPLPRELVTMIFKNLLIESEFTRMDLCTAACFALTCMSHWDAFRELYPDKVSLNILSPGHTSSHLSGDIRLGDLLKGWMAPLYRPIRWSIMPDHHMEEEGKFHTEMYVGVKAYDVEGGEEKEKALARRYSEFKINRFSSFHAVYRNFHGLRINGEVDLKWFVPMPCYMGEDWYAITTFILKHTILNWPPFNCTDNKVEDWLNQPEYTFYYGIWQTYRKWMLRDWVEKQPEAIKYKKLHGLGEGNEKTKSLRHGLQILRLVNVRPEKQKLMINEVVEIMIKNLRGRIDEIKAVQDVMDIDARVKVLEIDDEGLDERDD
ncbi:hypothetical protein DID88_005161 [Monilinia fructigena]|uniref:Uncharacterized protein n=1 Tax=Monilinia fructigena TaxID=38457 RepID=A0A395IDL2_9HELO|nr:hypothetical protein DID88_005161 [Monilinia fructigena]